MTRVYGTWYGPLYDTFAVSWRAGLRRNWPDADVVAEPSKPPAELIQRLGNHAGGNTHKLGLWRDAVIEAHADNVPLVLMDVDTFVFRPLDEPFRSDFDVAITCRDHRIAFNAGVVFVQPTDEAVAFFERWVQINADIVSDPLTLQMGRKQFGGCNQAALAQLLDEQTFACKVAQFPCSTWNSVDQTWESFDEQTAVVHFKGELRKSIVAGWDGTPDGNAVQRITWKFRQQMAKEAAA